MTGEGGGDGGFQVSGDSPDDLWLPAEGLWVPGQVSAEEMVRRHDDFLVRTATPTPLAPTYLDTKFARLLGERGELHTDIEKLAYDMGELAVNAGEVGLGHLRYGLEGYRMVTLACILRQDCFEHPDKIMRTMPVFYDELDKAFWLHVTGMRNAIQGWQQIFYSKQARNAQPAEAMLDFLSGHVRYDLGVSLLRTDTQDEHYDDYTDQVNRILREVAQAIIGHYAVFVGSGRIQGELTQRGLKLALRELFDARDDAWRYFELLSEDGAQNSVVYDQIRREMRRRTEARLISRHPARFAVRALTKVPQGIWDSDEPVLSMDLLDEDEAA